MTGPVPGRTQPLFAHASEAEMARILDFYAVRWEYEPHTFPILWTLDGEVVESFSPDFFLPDLDLHLEMTTLRQKLVRKKNRKLRRLRELYPELNVKLFYARDFRALMLKYGKVALADALSGAAGQPGPRIAPGPASADEGASPVARLDGDETPLVRTSLAAAAGRSRRRRRSGSAPPGERAVAVPMATDPSILPADDLLQGPSAIDPEARR
jgi:hypothetical protein